MKSRLTLLFICIATLTFAQYGGYYGENAFGIGLGYNLNSVVGKDMHPVEFSLRYRLNDEHLLQVYVPVFRQTNSFKSDDANSDMIRTDLGTKKRLLGIGFDYDYAIHTYSAFDFVIGARVEYTFCRDRSDLSNSYVRTDNYTGADRIESDDTFREEETKNFVVSPNVGLRLRINKVYIDAKFLISMLSMHGDVYKQTQTRRHAISNVVVTNNEITEPVSNNFELKSAVLLSMGFFF